MSHGLLSAFSAASLCCSSVCQKIIEKSFAWTVVPLFACHCDIQGTNYQLVLPKLIQENERRLGKNAMCHHQPLKLPSRKCSVHINLRILRRGSDWIWNDCSLSANPTLSDPTLNWQAATSTIQKKHEYRWIRHSLHLFLHLWPQNSLPSHKSWCKLEANALQYISNVLVSKVICTVRKTHSFSQWHRRRQTWFLWNEENVCHSSGALGVVPSIRSWSRVPEAELAEPLKKVELSLHFQQLCVIPLDWFLVGIAYILGKSIRRKYKSRDKRRPCNPRITVELQYLLLLNKETSGAQASWRNLTPSPLNTIMASGGFDLVGLSCQTYRFEESWVKMNEYILYIYNSTYLIWWYDKYDNIQYHHLSLYIYIKSYIISYYINIILYIIYHTSYIIHYTLHIIPYTLYITCYVLYMI